MQSTGEASNLPSAQQVEMLLLQLQQPQTVKAASEFLRKYLGHPACVPTLFFLMQASQHIVVRQACAIFLRKKLFTHWPKQGAEIQDKVKTTLMDALIKEEDRKTRHSIAQLCALVARLAVPLNEWPQFLPQLYQLTTSPHPMHREAALFILGETLEYIGDNLRDAFEDIFVLLKRCISPTEHHKVCTAAVGVLESIVGWLNEDQETLRFRELIPDIMSVIRRLIQENHNDDAIFCFSVFDEIVETTAKHLRECIPAIIHFVLEIGRSRQIALDVRVEALTFVQWVAQYKPKVILKNNLLEPILDVVFPMAAEPDDPNTASLDDSDDEFSVTAHTFGAQVIDSLARFLPTTCILEPCMRYINAYIQSSDPLQRKAAFGALTVLSRGCCDVLSEHADQLLPYLYKGFTDPDIDVRRTACLTLAQFAEYIPDILNYHETILPLLLKVMMESDEGVQERACYSLVAFAENLEEKILPYLQPLMQRLVELLRKGNAEIQEMAISAISAAAAAAGKHFEPYYQGILEMMKQLMSITTKDHILLRSRAIECAGIVATAVGKDAFAPALPFFMDAAVKGLKLPNSVELREFTYSFFGNVAEALQEDFKVFLPDILPLILEGLESNEGMNAHVDDDESRYRDLLNDDDESEEDEDNDDEEDGTSSRVAYTVGASFIDEKKQALQSLSVIALATGSHFVPYIEQCMKTIQSLADHIHPDIRRATLDPLEAFVTIVQKTFPPEKSYVVGLPPEEQPLSSKSQEMVDAVLHIVETFVDDEDKRNVGRVCDTIGHIVETCGASAVHSKMNTIATMLMNILTHNATCQQVDDPDDDEDETKAEDLLLFEATLECITKLASSYGPQFMPYFGLIELVASFIRDDVDTYYRQEAMGTIADVVNSLATAVKPKLDVVMQYCLRGLRDNFAPCQSNAAYLCGILCHWCGEETTKYYLECLQALRPLFDSSEDVTKDNACGAVGRMIINAPHAVPLSQVLPVFIDALPLRKDFEENKPAYGAIFKLFHTTNEAILPFIPKIVSLFSGVLGSPNIAQEIQMDMVNILKFLLKNFPQQMNEIAKGLLPQQQENLNKIIASGL